jgi:hypothetical protein
VLGESINDPYPILLLYQMLLSEQWQWFWLLISGFLSTVSVCFPAQIFPVFSDKSENF